jgi:hypothetical protein
VFVAAAADTRMVGNRAGRPLLQGVERLHYGEGAYGSGPEERFYAGEGDSKSNSRIVAPEQKASFHARSTARSELESTIDEGAILKRVSHELSQLMRLERPPFLVFIECAPHKARQDEQ